MRAVSSRYLTTLRGSHSAIFRARVCPVFQTGVNPDGVEIDISDEGGDVTSSAGSEVRSTLTMATPTKWPTAVGDLMAPYGNEIFVERGIKYGNGQTEMVGLGYYRINNPQQTEVPDGLIQLTCTDRWQVIIDGTFPTPRQFPSSTVRADLVQQLLSEVYPSAVSNWDDPIVASGTIGKPLAVESDRAGTITEMLTGLGKVGYFDYKGIFQIKTPADVTGAPVWTVDAGRNGVLTDISRSISREGVKNIYVAQSSSVDSSFPVRYVAADYGPNSPTRVDGRFGPVPGYFSSPLLLTTAQCRTAAETLLKKSLGLPYSVSLGAIPNAALEPGDVILVRYPEKARSRGLRTETHVLDEVKIPIGIDGPIQLKTREQPIILIGELAV